MATTESTGAWLTQEAFDRLSAELEHLSGPARQEVVARIEAAREEGDLKENGGYHAAKDEQGKIEARIRELKHLLENAKVGDAPADDGVIRPGMIVTAKVATRELTFLFGSREIASGTDLTVYSEKSPIGEAIDGHKVGDSLSYQAPNGKDIPVEIISVKPFSS